MPVCAACGTFVLDQTQGVAGASVDRLLILLICMSIAMLITAWLSIAMVLA